MNWTVMAALVIGGILLIAVDFYLPGFVLGSVGIVMMLVATAFCFEAYGLVPAAALFLVEAVLGVAAGYWAIKYLPQTALGRKMFLHHTQEGQRAQASLANDLVGKRGVAQTILRPSGMAMIDGKRVDVVAEAGVIEAAMPIEVVAVNENRIVVRKT
jgi:membrane-bound serine protease (ClpP class)